MTDVSIWHGRSLTKDFFLQNRWSVFLDRDGVLNRKAPEGDYVKTWAEFAWLPGALEALRKLNESGLRVFIVTNQQGVAKGSIRPSDLDQIHRQLQSDVQQAGGAISGIYVCPHLAGTCECRKPGTKLFRDVQHDFPDIVFERSVVVGDATTDIEAGRRLSARTVLIGNAEPGKADGLAASLRDAVANLILTWVRPEA